VFDWAWADAMQQAGRAYYPKLLAAIPFTPCPGARLLYLDDPTPYISDTIAFARASKLSSLHILLCTQTEAHAWQEAGCLLRQDVQFHWQRQGADHFEAYLAALTQPKRKRIKQERRQIFDAGITFVHLQGQDISQADWDFFYHCYGKTYAEHRSTPYLSRDFFERLSLHAEMAKHCLLILGRRGEERICAAFFVRGHNTLYGRYWGTTEHLSGLHFETCYYQAIIYCCAHSIDTFEGGAQGEHKLARGFLPTPTYSAHWFRDADMHTAVAGFLARETPHVQQVTSELASSTPYKTK
jgi:predicted N-acyltransferase